MIEAGQAARPRHILWIAGVGILAAGLTAVLAHSVSHERLERN
jgi:hypothetical protein